MKKFYLPIVAAATLFGANVATAAEPTLTAVWTKISEWPGDAWAGATTPINWNASNDMMGTNTGSRWGVGMNGKIYAVNCRTMSIMEFDQDGYRDVYKLPSLEGKTLSITATDDNMTPSTIADFYGTLISRDDAGHFIVGHGFTTSAMPCTWTVYDPVSNEGKTFYKDDLGFPGAPAGTFQRIDAVGRTLGNILDYGVMWVAPTGIYWSNIKGKPWAVADIQRTKIIQFSGDGENVAEVTAEGSVTSMTYLGNNEQTICQPRYNSIDELFEKMDGGNEDKALTEGYYLYSKNPKECLESNQYAMVMGVQPYGSSVATVFENVAETDLAKNYSGYVGFDTFTLGGKRYYATFYQTQDDLSHAYGMMKTGIFDENGMLIVTWDNPEYYSSAGRGAISAELIPDDENSAYIYVYCQSGKVGAAQFDGIGAAQLKFTVGDSAGIDNIIADEDADAPAVYYNLQGVEVANPDNGIYVVRRGNKVTKEIVK